MAVGFCSLGPGSGGPAPCPGSGSPPEKHWQWPPLSPLPLAHVGPVLVTLGAQEGGVRLPGTGGSWQGHGASL